jgi:hypothetical protein
VEGDGAEAAIARVRAAAAAAAAEAAAACRMAEAERAALRRALERSFDTASAAVRADRRGAGQGPRPLFAEG